MRNPSRILLILAALLALVGGGILWAFLGTRVDRAGDTPSAPLLTKAPPAMDPAPPAVTSPQPVIASQPPAIASVPSAIDPALLAPRREGDDFILGGANAQIVIIEFASLTCPHCARFHIDTLPKLKSEYVDTGLVKFIYRDFPLDKVALQAAQVARCLPAERYFSFLDVLFRQQEQWAAGKDAGEMIERVKQLGQLAGMPRDQSASCVADQALQLKIVGAAQAGEKDYQIRATPTIVINGKRHQGANSFEDLDKVLRPLVRKP